MSTNLDMEIKYLLSLSFFVTEDICENILDYFEPDDAHEKLKHTSLKKLSNKILDFLRKNISHRPFITLQILNKIRLSKFYDESQNKDVISQLIFDEVAILENSLKDRSINNRKQIINTLLFLISEYQWNFNDCDETTKRDIVTKLYQLKAVGCAKELYLSLLSQSDPDMMTEISEIEVKNSLSISWPLNPNVMIELCLGYKKHWLTEIISYFSTILETDNNVPLFSNNFSKKIWQLVLINFINNSPNTDVLSIFTKLKTYFSFIKTEDCDSSLHVYFNEIYRELNLMSFCLNNSKRKLLFGWNNMLQHNSALSIISQTCDLSQLEWFKVKQALTLNNDLLMKRDGNKSTTEELINWDIMTYNAYCIITSIMNIIFTHVDEASIEGSNLNVGTEEIKSMINNLSPVKYRIEILKNIFACLFIRFEYFSNDEEDLCLSNASHSDCSYFAIKNRDFAKLIANSRGFICKPELTKDLLYLLKDCIRNIYENYIGNTQDLSELNINLDDLKLFEDHILNAICKWELVNSIKIEPTGISCGSYYYNNIFCNTSEEENINYCTTKRKRTKARQHRSKSYTETLLPNTIKKKKSELQLVDEPDFISLMLASPDTLLALCLETNDFSKAYKIIEIYDLSDSEFYNEVFFTCKFIELVDKINNNLSFVRNETCRNEMEIAIGMSVISTAVVSLVEGFLSKHTSPQSYQLSDTHQTFSQLEIFESSDYSIITIIDLLLSTGINRNVTYGILNIAEKKARDIRVYADLDAKQSNFVTFIRNMFTIMYDIYHNTTISDNNSGICDILANDKIPMRHRDYALYIANHTRITYFHQEFVTLSNTVSYEFCNAFLEAVSKQRKLYLNHAFDTSNVENYMTENCYLKYFISYMESITKFIELEEVDFDDNNVIFKSDILNLPIHKIIGDLINKNVGLNSIEAVCKTLGVNFVHKIILNYCPPIKCKMQICPKNYFDELVDMIIYSVDENAQINIEKSDENILLRPNNDITTYILLHNWVIANLVKKIHSDSSDSSLQQSMDTRTKFLDAFLQRDRFDVFKHLYSESKILTSLQSDYDPKLLYSYLKQFIVNNDLLGCLNVLNCLTELMIENYSLGYLKDQILLNLSIKPDIKENWKYFLLISDVQLQFRFLFQNLVHWNYDGALEVLYYFANHNHSECEVRKECRLWIETIPMYEKISELAEDGDTWATIYEISNTDPERIIQLLLDGQKFDLCLKWSYKHEVSSNMRNLIIDNLLKQAIETPGNMSSINLEELLKEVPLYLAFEICDDILKKVRDLNILKMVITFIKKNTSDFYRYENIFIGIEILTEIEPTERVHFWNLISKPLLIIEQYLMNAKLDKLEKILQKIKPTLKVDLVGDNMFYNKSLINSGTISVNTVDALLRIYAEKSLNLKSTKNSDLSIGEQQEEILLQSIDSINFVGDSSVFVMPENVPNKENWIPDTFTNKCMVCKTTIFSILIRRHHCRRCGRLVCYSCSIQKITIPGFYTNIKVRVCSDCYNQMMIKNDHFASDQSTTNPGSGSAHSDSPSLEWCLSIDPNHNDAVRKEFVYEFSPDVNLCLSIMKMHTINLDYPRFLLDRSTELSRMVSNSESGVLELVQMRKALLVSCAVLYSRPMFLVSWKKIDRALAHTEHQLAVTDAMAHLATHKCHTMMPDIAMDSLDTHCVRKLLAAEKWELALDISTKFGLSVTGVLATWGKACLKCGCYKQARQKFAICFKNTSLQTGDDLNYATCSAVKRVQRSHLTKSGSQSEFYRNKCNSSLLDEIIALLEIKNHTINPIIMKRAEIIKTQYENFPLMSSGKKLKTVEPALSVLHALASVHKIRYSDFSDFSTSHLYAKKIKSNTILKKNTNQNDKIEFKTKLDPFFYNECIYYLSTYGSDNAVIKFYLKYGNLVEALKYCSEHSVDKDEFTESIFMVYLKNKNMHKLLQTMIDIDGSWKMWSEYLLHSCRELKHRGWLEALLEVQEGVDDHVRAAITCVELYKRPTQSPHAATLHTRLFHLFKAKQHLLQVPRNFRPDITEPNKCLQLKMDSVSVDRHVNTITLQHDITSLLYKCEMSGKLTEDVVDKITPRIYERGSEGCFLPSLFGTQLEKIKLCVIILVCGKNLEEGFCTVVSIIKDTNLDAAKIFCHTSRYLVFTERFEDIIKLCDHIKTYYIGDNMSNVVDEVVEVSVGAVVRKCESKGRLYDELAEMLISKTDNVSLKVSCYIECRILNSAYHLAAASANVNDIKKVMREAERLGQTNIKNACLKKLSLLNSL